LIRRHLQCVLTGQAAEKVETLRRRWDPVMAARTPAHLTLIYPEECDDRALLIERASQSAQHVQPFKVVLGEVASHEDGRGGVWYLVIDASRTWSRLRAEILAGLRPYSFEPHVTIVHPRTSSRGPEALGALAGTRIEGEFEITEIAYTETAESGMRILERFSLRGASVVKVVGAILRQDGRVLLCLRSSDRTNYPGVWDVPGGHVDTGESLHTALARELQEELGIHADVPSGAPWKVLADGDVELSLFLIDRWRGEITNCAPHEHEVIRWVSPIELEQLEVAHRLYEVVLAEAMK